MDYFFMIFNSIYPFIKLILFIATIVCIVKNKKKNINKDRISNVLSNYLIFAVVVFYICTVITDFIGYTGNLYILWLAPLPISIVFLIIFLLSRKSKNKGVLSVILFGLITVSMIFNIITIVESIQLSNYYRDKDYVGINEQQVEAHNEQYESYFGDRVLASNTRELLQKIRENNIIYAGSLNESAGEIMPIYVVFKSSNSNYTAGRNINEILRMIKSSRYYKISVYNEDVTDKESEPIIDAENKEVNNLEDWAGYHSNGYIRVIYIEELASESVNNTIQ